MKKVGVIILCVVMLGTMFGTASATTYGTSEDTYAYAGTETTTAGNYKYTMKLYAGRNGGIHLYSNALFMPPAYHKKDSSSLSMSISNTITIGKTYAASYSTNATISDSLTGGNQNLLGFTYTRGYSSSAGYGMQYTEASTISVSSSVTYQIPIGAKTGYYSVCFGSPFFCMKGITTIERTLSLYQKTTNSYYFRMPKSQYNAIYMVYSADTVKWEVY